MRVKALSIPEQTSLFDYAPLPVYGFQDLPSNIRWSYSRRNLLEKCLLAYYFHYYGAKLSKSNNDPNKEQLHILKSLKTRHLRTGEVLHLIIRTFLKKRQDGQDLTLTWAKSWANKILDDDLIVCLNFQNEVIQFSDIGSNETIWAEFYYRDQNAQELFEESRAKLLNALEVFFNNTEIGEFIISGSKEQALIESIIPYKTNDFWTDARPDLLFNETDNQITIVDWKIGTAGSSEDSLQLLVYALAVGEKFAVPPENISLFLAYLGDGKIVEHKFDKRQVLRAKARIFQDVSRMKLLDEFGKNANSSAFTPCEQVKICNNCVFRGGCHSFAKMSKSFLDGENGDFYYE